MIEEDLLTSILTYQYGKLRVGENTTDVRKVLQAWRWVIAKCDLWVLAERHLGR